MRAARIAPLALALAAALSLPRPALADGDGGTAGGGDAAAPGEAPAGFDAEGYAEALVAKAAQLAQRGEWASALAYLKYVETTLHGTRYFRDHAAEIRAAEDDADDQVAAQIFANATQLAEKNPAAAKQRLAKLRAEHGEGRFVKEKAAAVEALEAKVRTALWAGKASYQGAASLPRDGVVRVVYRFDRVEELGDFDAGSAKTPPRVDGGRLAAGKTGAVLRHRLTVPEGATFTAEVEARGHGKLALVLEGEAAESSPGAALVLEIDAGERALRLALRRGAQAESPEAEEPRSGPEAAPVTPWRVRVERRGGKVAAAVLKGEKGEEGARLEAGVPDAAFRPGLAFLGGKVEVETLTIEGPLPPGEADPPAAAAPGAGGPAAAARPPLPKRVWIPLAKDGLASWKTGGKWTAEDGLLRPESEPAWLSSKEIEGRAIDRYELSVEVRVESGERKVLKPEPLFAIVFPVGRQRLAWIFETREMKLDGIDGARHLAVLPFETWQVIGVKVGPQGIEAYVGAQRIFAVPAGKLVSSAKWDQIQGLGVIALPGPRKVSFRGPRIRVE